MNSVTLEELLRMRVDLERSDSESTIEITPDFRIAVQDLNKDLNPLGIERFDAVKGVHIIVHANGYNSDTLDFVVSGNKLIPF